LKRWKWEDGTCLPLGMGWKWGDGRWNLEFVPIAIGIGI